MYVVVGVGGKGEKWREGVICHSAAFSRASEWRHNLAAEMDATFGDEGDGRRREGGESERGTVRISVGVGGEGAIPVGRLSGGGRQHVIKPERASMMMLWSRVASFISGISSILSWKHERDRRHEQQSCAREEAGGFLFHNSIFQLEHSVLPSVRHAVAPSLPRPSPPSE